MFDRDSQLEKVLMGVPIGIAAAAVAYGGGHWVLVAMLSLVSLLVTGTASIEAFKAGSAGFAILGLVMVVVPVGFAGLIIADQQSAPSTTGGRPGAAGLERNSGPARNGAAPKPGNCSQTDLVSFAEVAQMIRIAKQSGRSGEKSADVDYAVSRVKAWEAVGVREFTAIDPATGRPMLASARWEALAKARKSFEVKIAQSGRQAMLTHEEAAWAAFTLGPDP